MKLQYKFGLTIIILTLIIQSCTSFNIDTLYPIVKRGLRGTYFGYSIAQHTMAGSRGRNKNHFLLVGAPRERINNSVTGCLHRCPASSPQHHDCTPIIIDLKSKAEEVEDQWLGASVVSQRTDDGKAVVCAPRYKDHDEAYVHGPGICVTLSNRLKKDDFLEPCLGRSVEKGPEEYGFCQAGFGLDIAEDGEVMVGAPGVVSGSGMVFVKRPEQDFEDEEYWHTSLSESFAVGKYRFQPPTRYYSYLGMSARFGHINGARTYVVGAPRSNGSGQVFLMQKEGGSLVAGGRQTLTGPVFGGSFGHEVAVVDLNSDGMDDLVIGAPFEYHHGHGGGAVYIYLNTINGISSKSVAKRILNRKMTDHECTQLKCIDARFGFSLARLGDLDGDGYQDLAIGAPYEGAGAIYIFQGSKEGIEAEYSQRISGRDMRPTLNTFGHSLAAGLDLDSNGDPDLAVGAYGSDAVVIFRTRSVIKGEAFMGTKPVSIDPLNEDCKSGRPCFYLKTCFKLKFNHRNNLKEDTYLNYRIETEPMKETSVPRVRFNQPTGLSSYENELFRMGKNERCIEQKIFLNPSNRDFYNPVVFRLSFGLSRKDGEKLRPHQPSSNLQANRPPSLLLPPINQLPILNRGTSNHTHLIHFKKNCANGEQCVSNLKLSAGISKSDRTSAGEYVVTVGEVKEIMLQVEVQNNEEEAHEAQLFVQLPSQIKHQGTDERGKHYSCNYEDNLISCSIGNPMAGNHVVSFGIRLDASLLDATSNDTSISLFVNTTSTEDETSDDKVEIILKVIVEAEMEVRGVSDPSEVYFGERGRDKQKGESKSELRKQKAVVKEEDIGPLVKHNYEVKNIKGGNVKESWLEVEWPVAIRQGIESKTSGSKHLLYLLDVQTDDNMECEMLNQSYSINPLNLRRTPQNLTENVRSVLAREKRSVLAREKRVRRSPSTIKSFFMDSKIGRPTILACGAGAVKCVSFRCLIGELSEGQSSVVKFVSRLWDSTFLQDFMDVDKVKVYSRAKLVIDRKWSIYQTNTKNDISETFTAVVPDQELAHPHAIDLWLVILALCLGLLLLLLLIFLLWKCGFFNRSKVEDPPFHQARLINQPAHL